jgi:hypothetical protein
MPFLNWVCTAAHRPAQHKSLFNNPTWSIKSHLVNIPLKITKSFPSLKTESGPAAIGNAAQSAGV